jgi:hypothetical protein
MTLNQTFTEDASAASIDWTATATHNVRVFYSPIDGGQLSGPFPLAVARQAAVVALGKDNVIKAVVEPMA